MSATPVRNCIARRQFVTTNCACPPDAFAGGEGDDRSALIHPVRLFQPYIYQYLGVPAGTSRQFLIKIISRKMKNRYIKFRCTKSEKERIEGMANRSGTTLSEYCRQQCLTGRILASRKLTPAEISYFRELTQL